MLVDADWLTALARALRRLGSKSGAALLVSGEITSPISWGLLRPTILLNEKAVGLPADAEAILAHELAHVVRLDWAKLLVARIVTALYWFNPFVWALARQCHQLREEAADDAVLRADVPSASYATLLIEAARGECRTGLAAHGVAPGQGSLKARVTRVLDGAARRTPTPAGWAIGALVGATLFAGPLAAVTLEQAEAAPERRTTVTGPKVAPAKPAAVTIAGAPSHKVAPSAIARSVPQAQSKPTATGTTARTVSAPKGKPTLPLSAASPSLAIDKSRAPTLSIAANPPRAPKAALAARRADAVVVFGKPGKIVLGEGLTIAGDGGFSPRAGKAQSLAPGVKRIASASSNTSHGITTKGKAIHLDAAESAEATEGDS